MAPRRGGGGGGLSSSSSDPSVWTESTLLYGTNFHDRYRVALVVIQAIFLFALIAIAIGALTIKKRSQSSQDVFKWWRYGLAMLFTFVFFGFSFIDLILEEEQLVVAAVYYLISTLINHSVYPAEIFQLVTVFAIISILNKRITPPNFLTKKSFAGIYAVFCAILFILFCATYALRIQYSVEATQDGLYSFLFYGANSVGFNLNHLLLEAAKISLAYTVLYMVGSLVALGLAGWTLVRSLDDGGAKQKLMAILLVALVAGPLFLRSIIEVGFVASYSLTFWVKETSSGAVAEQFFYYLWTDVVFAGIVAIMFHLAKDVPQQQQGGPMMYGPQQGMMSGANGGPYDGSAYAANGYQGNMQQWNKQPLVTQQPAPPYYYGQNNMQNGGAQPHSCPTCGDPRAAMPPGSPVQPVSPILNGHGGSHGMIGYGQAPEVTGAR